VELTSSAGVVGGDDEFSRCCVFNRRRCSGDGSLPKSHTIFFIFIFIFIMCSLFLGGRSLVQR